ncbi:reverse transcriptase domain-containing protein [Tanacetum coccineum]
MLTNITIQRQSPSGSGSLPSDTVANSRGDVKVITTRSGIAYEGPSIPPTSSSLPKEVEQGPEVIRNKVQTTSSESTAHVHPLVVRDPIPEPEGVPKPNLKPLIHYPSRINDQKLRKKANYQMLNNKKKLFELASTPLNENFAMVLLKKLPEKLGDPDKFLIPCDFSELDECLALADLGASINLMPLSVWKKLSLLELTPTLDYNVNPRVSLILGRPFFRTARALIDVHNVACEEYAPEVLGFLDSLTSGNPTPSDPIIASSSPLFTPFEGGYFILEEIETFLHTLDNPSNSDDDYYDTEGYILYLEKLLNEDPSPNLPPMKNEDLKQVDVTMTKPSIEEPPELELKDLPPHLEYAFLEGTDKLPIIISKELKDKEKAALLKVLKSHKRAIAWKISNIKGIDPRFYTHKILMEDDFKPVAQHQRRVNPKIHEVIKKELMKLLDARLIYPISDRSWVSLVDCVPKKGGMTVVKNEDNELIPTRLVTGWRILIDPQDQEKTTFTCPYGTFAYRRMPFGLCNASSTFQRCMMAIFHDMIEETMEVFMDDFSVFGGSFSSCLSHLDKMLKWCEDTNFVLNWEKCLWKTRREVE